jgi:rubrerythrin
MSQSEDEKKGRVRKGGTHGSDFGCRWCGVIILDEDLPEEWPLVCPECGKG